MTPTPYILRMAPLQVLKVWGGDRLARLHKKPPLAQPGPCGESWEVADLAQGQSHVDNGPLKGQSLAQVVKLWPEAMLGRHYHADQAQPQSFPLLVKLLDAQQDLSVQVHPGGEHVGELGCGEAPKDECWVILDVEPGGKILHGFKQDDPQRSLAQLVERGQLLPALRSAEVQPGQVIRVPPGTVHAICQGVLLLEIQQPSDTTYRIYDYNRLGIDGQPRALHLAQAQAVAALGPQPPLFAAPTLIKRDAALTHERLIQCEAYTIERLTLAAASCVALEPSAQPRVIFALKGALRLHQPTLSDEVVELAQSQTAIIPAGQAITQLIATADDEPAQLIIAWA